MTITTAGIAVHITPTVTKTLFKHYYKKAKRSLRGGSKSNKEGDVADRTQATDEFMFDEAFHIVKAFIEIGTNDTVEALQNFTDAPAPPIPWATTLQVIIPMESCDAAAKLIIEHLGESDLKKLVGGEKWWQLRLLPGVQGEWIAMSNNWKKMKSMEKKKQQQAEDGEQATKPSKPAGRMPKRRRDKRHERALSEIRAMREKTESALKRRSESLKRSSTKEASTPATAAPGGERANDVDDDDDAASTVSDESEVPPSQFSASDLPDIEDDDDSAAAEREELDRLERVMLYFHGGGYYFGSLATHRYQIVRYARKFGGKCFAPIYRKAPQYPWPCALQDALASYLYLIDPPKGAKHSAVDPKKLVVAGDSAGGNLTLALLTVIRDLGLPAPAGAVLISPWCDLTHSFPSILQNTKTDIIPPYGFIHKPSTLWPVNGSKEVSEEGKKTARKEEDESDEPRRRVPVGVDDQTQDTGKKDKSKDGDSEPAARKSFEGGNLVSAQSKSDDHHNKHDRESKGKPGIPRAPDLLWSDPIQIHSQDPSTADIELREQIQLYATNDQLTHPLCSAVLSGSLGGLPPLYILAGDSEVLRDEIIYLAHRAAHPQRYPLRKDLLDHSQRNRENAEKFDSQPTKVHLQVYDQMCHVLTAFAFTSQSRFAYRAVASFIKHVTGAKTNIKNPFPEVQEGAQGTEKEGEEEWSEDERDDGESDNLGGEVASPPLQSSSRGSMMTPNSSAQASASGVGSGITPMTSLDAHEGTTTDKPKGTTIQIEDNPLRSEPEALSSEPSPTTAAAAKTNPTGTRHRSMSKVLSDTLHGRPRSSTAATSSSSHNIPNEYAGQVPLLPPSFQSFMIRERVDVRGYLRPLEPESELQALQVPPEEVGQIKTGPVERYLTGQKKWAKRYAKTARKVEKRRAKNERLAVRMLEEALEQGLLDLPQLERKRERLLAKAGAGEPGMVEAGSSSRGLGVRAVDVAGAAQKVREQWSWLAEFGPMDLSNERPPPTAIAGRRDTDDALVLLRRSLQIRARAYGIARKSRFWGAEDRPVRAHLRAATETDLTGETSADPSGKTTGEEGEGKNHHRGLRVWNFLMVRKPPGASSASKRKGKASRPGTPKARPEGTNLPA